MRILDKSKATEALGEYAVQAKVEPVIVTSRGKPIAALVALENVDMETVSLSTNPEFIALIERSRARQAAEGGISLDEMRRRLQLTKARQNKAIAPKSVQSACDAAARSGKVP